jgi:hypothetical protein
MADAEGRRRRFVVKAEGQESAATIRHTITLPRRTSGLLAYYAQTRGLTQSNVVAQALAALFRGMRIADPGAGAGEEDAAA